MVPGRFRRLFFESWLRVATGHRGAHQFVHRADAEVELRRRELAQVGAQVGLQPVGVGGAVQAAIQQVQHLQHDQANRSVIGTDSHHLAIAQRQRGGVAPGETTLGSDNGRECAHRRRQLFLPAMFDPKFEIFLQLSQAALDSGETEHEGRRPADEFEARRAQRVGVHEALVWPRFQSVALGQPNQHGLVHVGFELRQ